MLLIFTLAAFQGTWAAPEHGTLVVIQSVCFYVRVASCSEHTNARGRMMTEVTCLAALFLTVPASAASAERSFGTLRHIKSYLGQPCHRWCLCMLIVNELEALVWTISYESSCWRQPNGEKPSSVYKPLAILLLLKNIHRGKKKNLQNPKLPFCLNYLIKMFQCFDFIACYSYTTSYTTECFFCVAHQTSSYYSAEHGVMFHSFGLLFPCQRLVSLEEVGHQSLTRH